MKSDDQQKKPSWGDDVFINARGDLIVDGKYKRQNWKVVEGGNSGSEAANPRDTEGTARSESPPFLAEGD